MSKRRSRLADASNKQSRGDAPLAMVISGLSTEDKIATARCILKELQHATVLVSDLETGRLATSSHKAFEVKEYTTATPQLPPGAQDVVVIPHALARPSRIAEAMASDGHQAQLVTVVDARTFLDDLEQKAPLPRALVEAAKKDDRAHLVDLSVIEVLAEFVESADVIVLSHTEHADADELELMEGILRELNPSATVVRRTGAGSSLLVGVVRASPDRPAPKERSGCWQAILAARRQDSIHEEEEVEMEEEGDGGDTNDGNDDGSDDEEDKDAEDEDDDEAEEDEEEGKEDVDPNLGEEEGEEEGEEGWEFPELCHFTFFARRPFHPGRLHKLLNRGGLEGVLRSKGSIWIASHPEDAILWSQVRSLASARFAPWALQ